MIYNSFLSVFIILTDFYIIDVFNSETLKKLLGKLVSGMPIVAIAAVNVTFLGVVTVQSGIADPSFIPGYKHLQLWTDGYITNNRHELLSARFWHLHSVGQIPLNPDKSINMAEVISDNKKFMEGVGKNAVFGKYSWIIEKLPKEKN